MKPLFVSDPLRVSIDLSAEESVNRDLAAPAAIIHSRSQACTNFLCPLSTRCAAAQRLVLQKVWTNNGWGSTELLASKHPTNHQSQRMFPLSGRTPRPRATWSKRTATFSTGGSPNPKMQEATTAYTKSQTMKCEGSNIVTLLLSLVFRPHGRHP